MLVLYLILDHMQEFKERGVMIHSKFHWMVLKMEFSRGKIQGVTNLPPLKESRPEIQGWLAKSSGNSAII